MLNLIAEDVLNNATGTEAEKVRVTFAHSDEHNYLLNFWLIN